MNENTLNSILKEIKNGSMPLPFGCIVDEEIFLLIAETAAKNIRKWKWEKYVNYIECWKLRIR